MNYDRFNQPLAKEYDQPIMQDTCGRDIYKDSPVYLVKDAVLTEDSLKDYSDSYVEDLTTYEAYKELEELMLKSEFEELIKGTLKEWFRDNGYVKPFDMKITTGGLLHVSTL
ncbi:hypothetical protein ACHEVJ_17010 [Enterococcus raffinosus]|uniref:hypothetical protein n=1 Tax=Enterococcus TaxID=1350 RepID=UPI0008A4FEF4|nr:MULTISPECIES: hypothetical protein [Enterococcus]MCS5465495.1 hypothetical protein [Enterococcus lactis]MDK7993079.1 hypothetical protein [Enterococcus raffinosus]MDT2554759.1 hypothetical protein [Enterococcus raffinosus]MDT2580039.1 hypothetical protein [Enterococcus raffinosus]OFT89519.1 hypothetical protein HMPREF3100_03185 [Enterococcus sp. HMSC29A04]